MKWMGAASLLVLVAASAAAWPGGEKPPAAPPSPGSAAPQAPASASSPDAAPAQPSPASLAAPPAPPDTSARYRLRVGSRLYEEWSEEVVVAPFEKFFLGDTDLTASVLRYYNDFKMIDGKVVDASPAPNNPAVFVLVTRDTAAVDSAYAFRNFPPHFSARSFFTFQLMDLDPAAEGAGKGK